MALALGPAQPLPGSDSGDERAVASFLAPRSSSPAVGTVRALGTRVSLLWSRIASRGGQASPDTCRMRCAQDATRPARRAGGRPVRLRARPVPRAPHPAPRAPRPLPGHGHGELSVHAPAPPPGRELCPLALRPSPNTKHEIQI